MEDTTEFTWPDGKRAAISITFDDARISQLDAGLPILDAHGVKATFYVSLGLASRRVEEWRTVAERGHEIGNHTLSHPCSGNFRFSRHNALEAYTLERMESELTGANEEIRKLLGVEPTTFAYPCGQTYVGRGEEQRSYVPLVARHFRAGRGFQGESANYPPVCDLAQLLSINSDGLTWDQLKPWIDATVEQGDWLIMASHEVGPTALRQTMMSDTLEQLCRYATDPANGIWVDTLHAIGAYVADAQARMQQR